MVAQVAMIHHVLLLPQQHVLLDLQAVHLQLRVPPPQRLPVMTVLALSLLRLLGLLLRLRRTALGLRRFLLHAVLVSELGQDTRGLGLVVEDANRLHSGFDDIAIFLFGDWL